MVAVAHLFTAFTCLLAAVALLAGTRGVEATAASSGHLWGAVLLQGTDRSVAQGTAQTWIRGQLEDELAVVWLQGQSSSDPRVLLGRSLHDDATQELVWVLELAADYTSVTAETVEAYSADMRYLITESFDRATNAADAARAAAPVPEAKERGTLTVPESVVVE